MAERGQETAGAEGADPGADRYQEFGAAFGAEPGAEIDERLVEQALAGAWYVDPRHPPDGAAAAAARDGQRALVRGMMTGLGPRDMAERIWAEQTTAAHLAATDAFRWLAEPELPASARIQVLRLAAQMMTVTGRQLAGLDLHRARQRADAEARERAADRARRQAEAVDDGPPRSGVVIEPLDEDPVVMARRWATEVKANERRLRAGLPLGAHPDEAAGAGPEGARPDHRAPDGGASPPPDTPPPDPPAARAAAPGTGPRAAQRPAQGRQGGVLLVPEKPSREEWTHSLREYYRVLAEPP